MRIGIVREELHAAVAVHPLKSRTRRTIANSAVENLYLLATCSGNGERLRRCRKQCLNIGSRFTQMNRMCSHVSHFQNPLFAKFPLDSKVPLLRVGNHKVTRNGQGEQEL